MGDSKMGVKNAGHKILLVGENLSYFLVQNEISRDDADISYFKSDEFSKIDRLINYTICIVDYTAFSNNSHNKELFFKQIIEAVEYGVNFCVVYFDNQVDGNLLGSQILKELKLATPYRTGKVIHDGKSTRKEFYSYSKRWGSSTIAFKHITERTNPLFKTDHVFLGLLAKFEKAIISYVPFLRNVSDKVDLKEGFETLIDSLLTLVSNSQTDLPVWAKDTYFFSEEKVLFSEKEGLQKKLLDVENKLQIFINAKSLLLQREYNLEDSLIQFLENELELKIFREEKYKEDFWLINYKEEKVAIAEIKSANKGFKRGMIFKVLDHKSENELSEDFPTLLFVNCNLQVGSWKDKEKQHLNNEESKYAADHNVLIIRVEDVVRLWEKKRQEQITAEEILRLFLTEKGWLHVKQNLEIEINPKPKSKKK